MKLSQIQTLLELDNESLKRILDDLSVEDFRLILRKVEISFKETKALDSVCRVFYHAADDMVRVGYQANTNFGANFPETCEYIKPRLSTFEDYQKKHRK